VSRESETHLPGSHILSKEILDHEKEKIESALKETKGRISGAKALPFNSAFHHRHWNQRLKH
jgi:hypothetical protein